MNPPLAPPLYMPIADKYSIEELNRQFGLLCRRAIDVLFPREVPVVLALAETKNLFHVEIPDGEVERVERLCRDLRNDRHGEHFALTVVTRDGADHAVLVINARTAHGAKLLKILEMLYIQQQKEQMAELVSGAIIAGIMKAIHEARDEEEP